MTFYKIYNPAFDKAFSLKRLSWKRAKDKRWITSGLKACIAIKDILFQTLTLRPTTENRTKHTKYKNILISCLRKAKENYYKELVNNERQNLYSLWKIFGDIVHPQKARKKKTTKINSFITTEP